MAHKTQLEIKQPNQQLQVCSFSPVTINQMATLMKEN